MLCAQALALLVQGQQKTGLAVGTVVSAALLLLDIKRAYDVGACHCRNSGKDSFAACLHSAGRARVLRFLVVEHAELRADHAMWTCSWHRGQPAGVARAQGMASDTGAH